MWRHRLRISGMIRNDILRTGNNFCQQVNESVGFPHSNRVRVLLKEKLKLSWQFFFTSNELKQCWAYKYPINTARKSKFTEISSWQIWCKKVQTRRKLKAKMVNTAFVYRFIWGCKFVVFTIFAHDLTLVCTFLHHICTK